ncbi:MAG: hypothetical protein O3A30_03810 [Bacteroidetes bacterium]|nr:hypothetical protein [Bacteroidota bacterium]
MAKVSQRQVLADIAPVNSTHPKWEGFRFAQVSGGEITASVEKIYEGGAKFPTVLCAPFEIGDITLTAHYDDDRIQSDGAAGLANKIARLRSLVGQAYYNINIKTYNCDIEVIGTDRVYPSALLVGLTEPEGDSSSGAPATFSMTFAIQNVNAS